MNLAVNLAEWTSPGLALKDHKDLFAMKLANRNLRGIDSLIATREYGKSRKTACPDAPHFIEPLTTDFE